MASSTVSKTEDRSLQFSRLGSQREIESDGLITLLKQKREQRESGVASEDPDIMGQQDVEIYCYMNRLTSFPQRRGRAGRVNLSWPGEPLLLQIL